MLSLLFSQQSYSYSSWCWITADGFLLHPALSVECKCVSSQHWKYWGCVFYLGCASRITLKRTWAGSMFQELASILVNRIGEEFLSLVTNHSFLPGAPNTAISPRRSNLNGYWIKKVIDPREIFFKGAEKGVFFWDMGEKKRKLWWTTKLKRLSLSFEFSILSPFGS